MKNPLKNLIGRASSADASAALETRRAELEAAQKALEDAKAKRTAAIEADASDADISKLNRTIIGLGENVETSVERVTVAEKRLAEAEAAEQAEREAGASKSIDSIIKSHRSKTAEETAASYRALLKTVIAIEEAKIETARLAAIAGRPWGPWSFENAVRGVDGAEEVLKSSEVELWCDQHGTPLQDQPSRVNSDGNGGFFIPVQESQRSVFGGGAMTFAVIRRKFRREEFHVGDRDASNPEPLASTLYLPPIVGGRPAIWDGSRLRGHEPADILNAARAALDRIDEQLAELRAGRRHRGSPETRLIPLD